MSFYIETENGKNFTWHIKGKPKENDLGGKPKIILLQADGDELEIIINHFKNIPHSYGICTWRGELAQFIYDNL